MMMTRLPMTEPMMKGLYFEGSVMSVPGSIPDPAVTKSTNVTSVLFAISKHLYPVQFL